MASPDAADRTGSSHLTSSPGTIETLANSPLRNSRTTGEQDPEDGRAVRQRCIPGVQFEVPDRLTPRLFALAVMDQVRWIEGGLATPTRYLEVMAGDDLPLQRFKDLVAEALRDVRPPQPDSEGDDPTL
ncbi:hypothetical protein [Streptomyces krungchingensis]|uniref:hypothetical protein n=1 Tax=Streptomyces krungchingensis TaxID=1565034 RepID=UPI003CEB6964